MDQGLRNTQTNSNSSVGCLPWHKNTIEDKRLCCQPERIDCLNISILCASDVVDVNDALSVGYGRIRCEISLAGMLYEK